VELGLSSVSLSINRLDFALGGPKFRRSAGLEKEPTCRVAR
jgi:hypothetical protein